MADCLARLVLPLHELPINTENKMENYNYELHFPNDPDAGLRATTITVELRASQTCEMHNNPGSFAAHMKSALDEWFDGQGEISRQNV